MIIVMWTLGSIIPLAVTAVYAFEVRWWFFPPDATIALDAFVVLMVSLGIGLTLAARASDRIRRERGTYARPRPRRRPPPSPPRRLHIPGQD